jgi:hypothetical protein
MSTALLFFAAFLVMLITAAIMSALERRFRTHRVINRSFDIMDLEFPVDADELCLVINGIYRIPEQDIAKSVRALKTQLIVDFLFMPAAYGTIFLMCRVVSFYVPDGWHEFFLALGYVQLLAWICDIFENIYLLGHIHPYEKGEKIRFYRLYQFFVYIKWLTALIGAVCAVAAFAFLFFYGSFPSRWFIYLGIVVAALAIYFFATSRRGKRK